MIDVHWHLYHYHRKIGHGIATPRAHIRGLSNPILFFKRALLPILFGTPDHQPVSLFVMNLVSEGTNEENLRILVRSKMVY